MDDVKQLACYLKTKIPYCSLAAYTFLDKFVRRSIPDLSLIPYKNETIWVDLTPGKYIFTNFV